MAKNIKKYTIFLSGPSDVLTDVDIIKQCVHDINILLSSVNVQFDHFHWIEDATPGLGSDPQARINEQSKDYDAIIAIFGAKFGNPTEKYPSGTVEEIEKAILNKSNLTFGDNSIMIFFKKLAIDNSYGDLRSALKIREFKDGLGPRNILYKEYEEADLREYTLRAFSNLISKSEIFSEKTNHADTENGKIDIPGISEENNLEINDDIVNEDFGFLDYIDISEASFSESTNYLEIISSAMAAITSSTKMASSELDVAAPTGDRQLVNSILRKMAGDMDIFSFTLENAVPRLFRSVETALEAIENAILIDREDLSGARGKKSPLLTQLEGLIDSTNGALEGLIGLQRSVESTPRILKDFNSSKRRMLKVLEDYRGVSEMIINRSEEIKSRFG